MDALANKIGERRSRLEELEREILIVRAELRAYEDALRMLGRSHDDATTGTGRGRKLSADWAAVMHTLGNRPSSVFDLDAIASVARDRGFAPTRGNIRSQAAAYVARGLLERVADGQFRFTDAGMRDFANAAPREGATSTASEASHEEFAATPNEDVAA